MSKYHFAVFIGRFQPLHIGHQHVIREALKQADRVIVLVGSSNIARDFANPFTFEERKEMIHRVFRHEMATDRLIVEPLEDNLYNDSAWIASVQRAITDIILEYGNNHGFHTSGINDFKVALAGFGKDATGFYLKRFPEWESIQIGSQFGTFNASNIRAAYFQPLPMIPTRGLDDQVAGFLEEYMLTDEFKHRVYEQQYLQDYRKQYGKGPFLTADACVTQSGHVLLIRRGKEYGHGLLALPGGFVNENEQIRDAAVRELKEETKISDKKGEIPPSMLASFITHSELFDHPKRSLRGRIVTNAYRFVLPDSKDLFTVKGSDDAEHADWYRLGDLEPQEFFEDHWSILQKMIGF